MSDFEFEKKPVKGISKADVSQTDIPIEEASQEVVVEKPKKKEYPKEELERVFDEILFTGEYSEDVVIRGKLKVRFKTRNAEELSQISRVIDGTSYTLMQTLNENRLLLNLQYALVSYHGTDLSAFKVEDRAKFINRLAGPIISSLVSALIEFDTKVAQACEEIEENF